MKQITFEEACKLLGDMPFGLVVINGHDKSLSFRPEILKDPPEIELQLGNVRIAHFGPERTYAINHRGEMVITQDKRMDFLIVPLRIDRFGYES
jgi:hypothetical protein